MTTRLAGTNSQIRIEPTDKEKNLQDNIADVHILNRGAEIFGQKSDPKIPVNKPDIGRGEQILLGAGAALSNLFPGLGTAAGVGLSQLAARRSPEYINSRLNSLAEKPGKYNRNTNQYGNLSKWEQRISGITPDQVTGTILDQRNQALQNSPEVRELQASGVPLKDIMSKGSLTQVSEIQEKSNVYRKGEELRTKINDEIEGPNLLQAEEAKLGRKLTNPELQKVYAEALRQDPTNQRDERRLTIQEDAEERSDRTATANIRYNQGQLDLATIQEQNRRLRDSAEIDYKNLVNKYNYDIANREIEQARESSQLDRNLRRDLAVLGMDDKQAERQYQADRDERKDRQLMMLQLMKGLGNLGAAFAL